MNPVNNNHLRQALAGAQSRGVGTISEAEMIVHQVDANFKKIYLPALSN